MTLHSTIPPYNIYLLVLSFPYFTKTAPPTAHRQPTIQFFSRPRQTRTQPLILQCDPPFTSHTHKTLLNLGYLRNSPFRARLSTPKHPCQHRRSRRNSPPRSGTRECKEATAPLRYEFHYSIPLHGSFPLITLSLSHHHPQRKPSFAIIVYSRADTCSHGRSGFLPLRVG